MCRRKNYILKVCDPPEAKRNSYNLKQRHNPSRPRFTNGMNKRVYFETCDSHNDFHRVKQIVAFCGNIL